MIRVSRVGRTAFETPDLDRAQSRCSAPRTRAAPSWPARPGFCDRPRAGPRGGSEAAIVRVAPNADFDDMAKKLSADGVRSGCADAVPGIGKVLAFDDPKGTTIELFTGEISGLTSPSARRQAAQARPYRARGGRSGDGRFLLSCPGLQSVGLDRGLFRLPTLQPGSSPVNFIRGQTRCITSPSR